MSLRLIHFAQYNWTEINGEALSQGLLLRELELPDFLDYVWWLATRGMDQTEKDKFVHSIWMPPKGEVAETGPWSAEAETEALKNLKKQLQP